ncbi:NINE protein, partial [Staphylococcus arlettae]
MKVNKVIYVVLAFFLGWIGIHKFYSNQVLQG